MKSIVDRFTSEKDEKRFIAQLCDIGLTQVLLILSSIYLNSHTPYES